MGGGVGVSMWRQRNKAAAWRALMLFWPGGAHWRPSRSSGAAACNRAGDVRVNWRPGTKPSGEVKAGDMISVSGKGRLEVVEASLTKKGRYAVKMVRYM